VRIRERIRDWMRDCLNLAFGGRTVQSYTHMTNKARQSQRSTSLSTLTLIACDVRKEIIAQTDDRLI
jgi:hypothetical protein